MNDYETKVTSTSESEQVQFWTGKFGDDYSKRCNVSSSRIKQAIWKWSRILRSVEHSLPTSCVEIGSNVGINLHALNSLLDATMYAVEPNQHARETLAKSKILPEDHVFDADGSSIPLADQEVELSISCGVLIHIAPEDLLSTYSELYRVTSKYIVTNEYFSDRPEAIIYRGHTNKLFKRDFGALWAEYYSNLELVDYGFIWKGAGAQDNSNWWLHRKK